MLQITTQYPKNFLNVLRKIIFPLLTTPFIKPYYPKIKVRIVCRNFRAWHGRGVRQKETAEGRCETKRHTQVVLRTMKRHRCMADSMITSSWERTLAWILGDNSERNLHMMKYEH